MAQQDPQSRLCGIEPGTLNRRLRSSTTASIATVAQHRTVLESGLTSIASLVTMNEPGLRRRRRKGGGGAALIIINGKD
jgi:hypothetical protein